MKILPSDALIVVDVQKDFCPGGALAVPEGNEVIPPINALAPKFDLRVFTRDMHPSNHCSFSDTPLLVDKSWPRHCVSGTDGAAFHKSLEIPLNAAIISKGTDPKREAYSGFEGTDLHHVLREKNIDRVFVCGLATDYCVLNTALDAMKNCYEVVLVEDACRGVSAESSERALDAMRDAGIELCASEDLA